MSGRRVVRTTVMRGGTSRGLVLDARDLPTDERERERVVAALFGAGSPGQIDGLGGGQAHTSKVAVVQPSDDSNADVDYLFGQVSLKEATVDFSGTCGNLASAVALFAHERGMVRQNSAPGRVRVRQSNAGNILLCDVLTPSGQAVTAGGLSATGSPVLLDLAGMQGASAGAMLPTGQVRQDLALEDGRTVPCSIIDIGNVLAFVPADALGLTGHEVPEEIEKLPIMDDLAFLRGAVAVALGWTDDPKEWHRSPGRLPFIALVSPPDPHELPAVISVRLYAVGRIHRSIAVTAIAATAAGAALGKSVVQERLARPFAELLADTPPDADIRITVAHPAGTGEIGVRVDAEGLPTSLRYLRTARTLMEGNAYVDLGAS